MILYLSAVAAPSLYLERLAEDSLAGGYQVQRFNCSIVRGLAELGEITALSALPYKKGVAAQRSERVEVGARFIAIENTAGALHKPLNVLRLVREGKRILAKSPRDGQDLIICDAVSHAASAAALRLSRRFGIPAVAIVTDLPEVMYDGRLNLFGRISASLMKKYSAYVLLTEAMNAIANPKGKPHTVMEGLCAPDSVEPRRPRGDGRRIAVYSGSLWRESAGIERLIEGFRLATLPDCELHFYGTGDLVSDIERASAECPAIRYMGCLDNESMARRLRECDLLINPRPSDAKFCLYSFPSKTMDYMASGVPVLMTRLPGVPEEYLSRVYLIEDESPSGMRDALLRVFSKDEAELSQFGEEARRFVLTEKNYSAQTRRLSDFFERELGVRVSSARDGVNPPERM